MLFDRATVAVLFVCTCICIIIDTIENNARIFDNIGTPGRSSIILLIIFSIILGRQNKNIPYCWMVIIQDMMNTKLKYQRLYV